MSNEESILVAVSIAFIIVLYVVTMLKGPKMGVVNKNVFFDKTKLPIYLRFLFAVAVCSILVGLIVTRTPLLLLEFAGFNAVAGAVIGLNLFLYRHRSK